MKTLFLENEKPIELKFGGKRPGGKKEEIAGKSREVWKKKKGRERMRRR